MANMDPEEPSSYQVAIRNSGTTAVQRETLIQAEYNKLLREQVELASMGEAGAGMIAGPIDHAGLRQLAEKKVDETIAAYKLSEGGGNTPAAVGRGLDKIGELSAEEAQGQIDQQGWLYGTIIAKPMFCQMNNNYRSSGACGVEHASALNEEGLESARAYWTFLITGRTEQALQDIGMIIGDPRSPGFQGRDYNANVALPCGVRSSEGEEEVTDEELACLKGKNVEAQFRLAEVDQQNQTNAVLNVVAAGAGFAGGAIAGGARATSLIGKTGLFLTREGIVSDVFISPLFAETTTAGQRAGADALAALATAPDLSPTERETLSELAAQADEEADRAYTENLLMNAASTVVIGVAGSGAGRAAREVFGNTPLGRLLLGNLDVPAGRAAAAEVADALNNEVIAPASLFPDQVSRRVVSAEEVIAGVNKAKVGLSGNPAEALAKPGVVAGADVPVGKEVGGAVTTARTATAGRPGIGGIADKAGTVVDGAVTGIRNAAESTGKAVGEAFDSVREALLFGKKPVVDVVDLERPPVPAARSTAEIFTEVGSVEVVPKGGAEPYRLDYDPNNPQALDSLKPGDTVDDVHGQGWVKNEDGSWSSLGDEVGGGGEGIAQGRKPAPFEYDEQEIAEGTERFDAYERDYGMIPENLQLPKHPQALHLEQEELMRGAVELSKGNEYNPQQAIDLLRKKNVSVNIYNEQQLYYANLLVDKLSGRSVDSFGKPLPTSLPNLKSLSDIPRLVQRATEEGSLVRVPSQFSVGGFNVTDYRSGLLGGKKPVNGYVFILNPEEYGRTYRVSNPVDQQILFLQKLGHEAGHALDDLEFGLGKTASDTWGSELRQKEFNSMFYAAVDKTNPSISAAKLSRDYGNFLSTAQQRGNLTAPVPTIGKASSFSELKVAVKKQGGITSPSGQFYSVSELEDVIDEIVKGELSLSYATKADGFRAKVDELLKQQRRYRSETGGGFLQGVKNAAENTADNVRVFTNCGIAMSPIPQAYAAGGGGCITVSPGRSDVSELGEGVSVKPDADGQVVEFHSPGAEPIVIHQGETGVLPTGEKVQVVAVKSDGTAVVKPLNEGTKPSASAAQAGELSEVITKPLENNPELLSTVGPFVKTAQDMLKRKPDVIFLPGDSAVRYEEAIRSIAIASGIDEVPPIIAFPTGNQWVSVEKEIGGQIVKVGQELPGPNMLAYKDLSDFTFAGSRIGINGVFNTADSVMQRRLRITPNDERLLAIQDILKSSREDYNRRPSGFVSKFWEPTIEFRLALLELFYPEKMSALASARSVAFFDDVALTGRKLCCYEDLFDNNIDRSIERYVVIAENKARVPEGTHVGATQDVAVYPFLREYLEEETSISIRQVKLHNKAFDYESLFAGIASPEERNRLREAFFTSAAEFTEGQPVYPSKFRANEYIEFLQRETATPNKLERVTDDLSGAVRLPCNPITSAIIPQVYAGSRDPCQITLFGPNGPAAKASKAVKDLFAGEELPARTISPADENIAETIQLFFKTPLSDFPQSTVGRIGGGTTTATVVGAADNPTAVVLQLQSGLITVKPAVDQPLTVNQAKGIIAQLKNDNPNGFAVTLPTRRQGLIGGRTFGDILSSKGLVSDVNGRLTWIPDAKPREIKTPKGYTLAQTESDGIQYFSVKKDGQTAAVVAYDPNSRMILDVKSNSGAEAEAVQTVVNHLSGKQDFAGVEISGWLSRDQATAQTLAESGLVTTPAGRYTYLPEFIPKPNTAQRIGRVVVLTGAGILALVGLDQLANQPEAEPVIPLEIGKIPPEYADLEVKPVDEEVVESPLVEESPLPQVGPELEAYLRTEMAEFKEIQEAMQDASITGLIDRKLDEMDQLPDNEPIKDPETIALLGTMVGFEEISAKDWTVGEVRIVLEALKSVEPMDFLLNGVPKIYFVKVDGDQLPENRYGTSGDCNIFNQPDDKALNRCIKLYPLHLYSDIISQFRYDYQDADFTYSPAVAKIAHEIGHVLHYQREGDGFTLNPVFRRFNELFYDGRQVSVPNEEAGGGLQVLSYYPPAVLKEGAPTVYSATGGVYEDWADSVALFTNAHDAFCDQRPLRCGYLACVTSGTPSAQCDIVEKDENGKVRVIPNLEEAGMGIEQFESERLSQ